TTLAWDDIDRLEETLSSEVISHQVNGIVVQANHFGLHPPSDSAPIIAKSKRRIIESMNGEIPPQVPSAYLHEISHLPEEHLDTLNTLDLEDFPFR
ncbi:unnamed protein product, partial [Pocillopora meandrina]